MERFRQRWTVPSWTEYAAAVESPAQLREIRQRTHTGRPLGQESFIREIEDATKRELLPQKGGRPRGRILNRNCRSPNSRLIDRNAPAVPMFPDAVE
jgi:hypothetical protein